MDREERRRLNSKILGVLESGITKSGTQATLEILVQYFGLSPVERRRLHSEDALARLAVVGGWGRVALPISERVLPALFRFGVPSLGLRAWPLAFLVCLALGGVIGAAVERIPAEQRLDLNSLLRMTPNPQQKPDTRNLGSNSAQPAITERPALGSDKPGTPSPPPTTSQSQPTVAQGDSLSDPRIGFWRYQSGGFSENITGAPSPRLYIQMVRGRLAVTQCYTYSDCLKATPPSRSSPGGWRCSRTGVSSLAGSRGSPRLRRQNSSITRDLILVVMRHHLPSRS